MVVAASKETLKNSTVPHVSQAVNLYGSLLMRAATDF
jgi:hypothetical protein